MIDLSDFPTNPLVIERLGRADMPLVVVVQEFLPMRGLRDVKEHLWHWQRLGDEVSVSLEVFEQLKAEGRIP